MNIRDVLYTVSVLSAFCMSAYNMQSYKDLSHKPTFCQGIITSVSGDSVILDTSYAATSYAAGHKVPEARTVTIDGVQQDLSANRSWSSRSDSIVSYSLSGRRNVRLKMLIDTVTVTASTGFSINTSAVGFSGVFCANAIAIRNTTTATSVPNVSIKSFSTTALELNFTEGNPNTINLLGSLVGLGISTNFASLPGLKVAIFAIGY